MYLKPDLSTLSILPWEDDGQIAAQVICSMQTPEGELFRGDPRTALTQVVREAKALGFDFIVAPELEFILFSPQEGNKMDYVFSGPGRLFRFIYRSGDLSSQGDGMDV